MDRRRGQPLGLGRDDRVDRPALQPDLAAQSVALLLVEIDVVVGIVEEALVLLDEIAADADSQVIGERDIDRALRLEAVVFEAIPRATPARKIDSGLGRDGIERAANLVACGRGSCRARGCCYESI